MAEDRGYLETLRSIAEMARSVEADESPEMTEGIVASHDGVAPGSCILKRLPARLLVKAAETAIQVNPLNAHHLLGMDGMASTGKTVPSPQRISVVRQKYWGPSARQLPVSFMENTPLDLKDRIIAHLNAWAQTSCVSFVRTNGVGVVRISRGPGGYYSYLGTDVLLIPQGQQTMNLEGFTMQTSEAEFRRVVRHEAGHTLGFPHEHMRAGLVARIDRDKAYVWFWENYGWDPLTVDQQVLTPLDEASLFGTPVDQTSIMCYQLPGSITKDGQPIPGGLDINTTDYLFAGSIYPKLALQMPPGTAADWDERDDVLAPDVQAGLLQTVGSAPVGV
ncbi:M12 family metallopeptidase [Nonomuraea fuscirosea]|uniref:M12 family metallopeptidase n=1 Tax=Nonomuraea fuscirosea TaxID=1291556 RepID=UPI003449A8D3